MKAMTANEALAKMRQAADLIVELREAGLIIGADLMLQKRVVTFQLNSYNDGWAEVWRTMGQTAAADVEPMEEFDYHRLRDGNLELLTLTGKEAAA